MQTKDILASVYVLLDNADEDELELSLALELFASMLTMMKFEQIFGNLDDVIIKDEVLFSDTTGVVTNSLTDFGDVVYVKFNNEYVDECPVSQLELYRDSGMQRVAFWTDAETGTKKIQLAIPQIGTLQVWYEPYTAISNTRTATVDLHDSLRWCLCTRLAHLLLPYVRFKNPDKMMNKPNLALTLSKQAEDWKKVYLEKVNRIGTNKPFERLPFQASIGID